MKNQYFSYGTKSEQQLYDDLVRESIEIYGLNCYYIPRTLVNYDKLFGEDGDSRFDTYYLIEMYLESYQNFEGQGDLFTKFGIQINDQAVFTVSRTKWNQIVGCAPELQASARPNEGDLIYYPLGKNFFQINFVEHEDPFWQVGENQMYKMRCELFAYDQEVITKDVEEVSNVEKYYSFAITLTLSNIAGSFIEDEIVVSDNLSAIVRSIDGNKIRIYSRNEDPVVGATLVGTVSNATAEIASFSTIEETNRPFDSDNKYFEDTTRKSWEYEEDNAFGEFQLDDSF